LALAAACCCGIDTTNCTCDGTHAITVVVVDNFGYSYDGSGSYLSGYNVGANGCVWDIRTPNYDAGGTPDLIFRIRAPVITLGFLNVVQCSWLSYEFGVAGGNINVANTPGVFTYRFNHPGGGGRYIDATLTCP